jgi:hypothetical protein
VEIFSREINIASDFNRADKNLSSGKNVTAARVVQETALARYPSAVCKNKKRNAALR